MKKSLTCVLLCVALLCNSTVFVHAAGDGGEFGYNNSLSWYFDGVDTLSISGKGAMNTWYSNIPWRDYKEMVKKVIINEGVTV